MLDFLKLQPKVNGPKSRGAAYPPYDEEKINESKFEDCNRYKEVDYKVISDNYAILSWESQEPCNGQYTEFKEELIRYFKYIANKYKMNNEFTIEVRLFDRDDCENYTFYIELNNDN